jgi:hypothetical protein
MLLLVKGGLVDVLQMTSIIWAVLLTTNLCHFKQNNIKIALSDIAQIMLVICEASTRSLVSNSD